MVAYYGHEPPPSCCESDGGHSLSWSCLLQAFLPLITRGWPVREDGLSVERSARVDASRFQCNGQGLVRALSGSHSSMECGLLLEDRKVAEGQLKEVARGMNLFH